VFNVIRFELGNLFQRIKNVLNPIYVYRLLKLKHNNTISLNLGSGGNGRQDWINIDARPTHHGLYIAYDIRRKLPIRSSTVERIYAEHVIEHLDFRYDIPKLFAECYRVMKPGSIFRIVVPDVEKFVNAYVSKEQSRWDALGLADESDDLAFVSPMHVLNHVFHQEGEHLFGYDFDTLRIALENANLKTVVKQAYNQSLDKELCMDQQNHEPYSLYVDAKK